MTLDTRVCRLDDRVETLLLVGARPPVAEWMRNSWADKRRDDSRRGRHECPRHKTVRTAVKLTAMGPALRGFILARDGLLVISWCMAFWQVQDAKARFCEFLEAAVERGPQIVTRGGVETAVLVSVQEWRRLQSIARPSLKDLLLAPHPRFEGVFEERRKVRRRT